MLISFAYIVYSEGYLDKSLHPLPNENVNSEDKLTVYLLCSVCIFVIYILKQLWLLSVCFSWCVYFCFWLSLSLPLCIPCQDHVLPLGIIRSLRIHVPVRVLPTSSMCLQMFFHQAVGGVPLHLSQRAGSCSSGWVPVCSKSSTEPRLKPALISGLALISLHHNDSLKSRSLFCYFKKKMFNTLLLK